MINWMEVIGISLQLLAGLIFILDQIARNFSTSIGKWARSVITFATEKATRRWRIVTLLSIVALPVIVIIITLTTFGTNEEITWTAIGGVLIFTLIGFNSYGLLLTLVGKRTLRGDIAKHIKSLIEDRKLVSVNVILLVISCIALAGFVYVVSYMQPKTDNIVLQILQVVLIFINALVFLPTLLFSLLFLILEGVFHLIHRMVDVKHPEYYWIVIAVLWVAGGGFLLANALCK